MELLGRRSRQNALRSFIDWAGRDDLYEGADRLRRRHHNLLVLYFVIARFNHGTAVFVTIGILVRGRIVIAATGKKTQERQHLEIAMPGDWRPCERQSKQQNVPELSHDLTLPFANSLANFNHGSTRCEKFAQRLTFVITDDRRAF
jgi:hypothetical protein